MASHAMLSYNGLSKDHMSSDGGGGILMQIAADISAPLSNFGGDPGLHDFPAELAAQFADTQHSSSGDPFLAPHLEATLRSHTQQLPPPCRKLTGPRARCTTCLLYTSDAADE